jgi:hypothetical protein
LIRISPATPSFVFRFFSFPREIMILFIFMFVAWFGWGEGGEG